ncbi:MAG: hypothetical protein AAGA09_03460 [Pseudomonadota bacterium]
MVGPLKYVTLATAAAGGLGAAVITGGPLFKDIPDKPDPVIEKSLPVSAAYTPPADGFEICLTADAPFFKDETAGCYDRDDVDRLRDLKLLSPSGAQITMMMAHPTDYDLEPAPCATCREYAASLAEGWYAPTTRDIRREAFFQRACGFIDMLATAEAPREPFFGGRDLSADDVEIIARAVAFGDPRDGQATSSAEKDQEEAEAVQADDGRWTMNARDERVLVVSELARADFDGDGVEDVLVFLTSGYEDGSARVVDLGLLRGAPAREKAAPSYVSRSALPPA